MGVEVRSLGGALCRLDVRRHVVAHWWLGRVSVAGIRSEEFEVVLDACACTLHIGK